MMAATPDRIAWPNLDPRTALSKLTIPGLWVFGGQDRNMYVDVSVDRLDGLIKNGHHNYEYRLFPNYDHQLGNEGLDVMQPTVEWIRNSLAGARR